MQRIYANAKSSLLKNTAFEYRRAALLRLELLNVWNDEFNPKISQNIAIEITSLINRTNPHFRKKVEFAEKIRRYLIYLLDYNCNIEKITGKYPRTKELDNLFVCYIELVYEVLYNSSDYSPEYESVVVDGLFRFLENKMYDICVNLSVDLPIKTIVETSTISILKLASAVRKDYRAEKKLVCNLINKLLSKIGLLDEINLAKNKKMPILADKLLKDPDIQKIQRSLCTSDYGTDESEWDCESVTDLDVPSPAEMSLKREVEEDNTMLSSDQIKEEVCKEADIQNKIVTIEIIDSDNEGDQDNRPYYMMYVGPEAKSARSVRKCPNTFDAKENFFLQTKQKQIEPSASNKTLINLKTDADLKVNSNISADCEVSVDDVQLVKINSKVQNVRRRRTKVSVVTVKSESADIVISLDHDDVIPIDKEEEILNKYSEETLLLPKIESVNILSNPLNISIIDNKSYINDSKEKSFDNDGKDKTHFTNQDESNNLQTLELTSQNVEKLRSEKCKANQELDSLSESLESISSGSFVDDAFDVNTGEFNYPNSNQVRNKQEGCTQLDDVDCKIVSVNIPNKVKPFMEIKLEKNRSDDEFSDNDSEKQNKQNRNKNNCNSSVQKDKGQEIIKTDQSNDRHTSNLCADGDAEILKENDYTNRMITEVKTDEDVLEDFPPIEVPNKREGCAQPDDVDCKIVSVNIPNKVKPFIEIKLEKNRSDDEFSDNDFQKQNKQNSNKNNCNSSVQKDKDQEIIKTDQSNDRHTSNLCADGDAEILKENDYTNRMITEVKTDEDVLEDFPPIEDCSLECVVCDDANLSGGEETCSAEYDLTEEAVNNESFECKIMAEKHCENQTLDETVLYENQIAEEIVVNENQMIKEIALSNNQILEEVILNKNQTVEKMTLSDHQTVEETVLNKTQTVIETVLDENQTVEEVILNEDQMVEETVLSTSEIDDKEVIPEDEEIVLNETRTMIEMALDENQTVEEVVLNEDQMVEETVISTLKIDDKEVIPEDEETVLNKTQTVIEMALDENQTVEEVVLNEDQMVEETVLSTSEIDDKEVIPEDEETVLNKTQTVIEMALDENQTVEEVVLNEDQMVEETVLSTSEIDDKEVIPEDEETVLNKTQTVIETVLDENQTVEEVVLNEDQMVEETVLSTSEIDDKEVIPEDEEIVLNETRTMIEMALDENQTVEEVVLNEDQMVEETVISTLNIDDKEVIPEDEETVLNKTQTVIEMALDENQTVEEVVLNEDQMVEETVLSTSEIDDKEVIPEDEETVLIKTQTVIETVLDKNQTVEEVVLNEDQMVEETVLSTSKIDDKDVIPEDEEIVLKKTQTMIEMALDENQTVEEVVLNEDQMVEETVVSTSEIDDKEVISEDEEIVLNKTQTVIEMALDENQTVEEVVLNEDQMVEETVLSTSEIDDKEVIPEDEETVLNKTQTVIETVLDENQTVEEVVLNEDQMVEETVLSTSEIDDKEVIPEDEEIVLNETRTMIEMALDENQTVEEVVLNEDQMVEETVISTLNIDDKEVIPEDEETVLNKTQTVIEMALDENQTVEEVVLNEDQMVEETVLSTSEIDDKEVIPEDEETVLIKTQTVIETVLDKNQTVEEVVLNEDQMVEETVLSTSKIDDKDVIPEDEEIVLKKTQTMIEMALDENQTVEEVVLNEDQMVEETVVSTSEIDDKEVISEDEEIVLNKTQTMIEMALDENQTVEEVVLNEDQMVEETVLSTSEIDDKEVIPEPLYVDGEEILNNVSFDDQNFQNGTDVSKKIDDCNVDENGLYNKIEIKAVEIIQQTNDVSSPETNEKGNASVPQTTKTNVLELLHVSKAVHQAETNENALTHQINEDSLLLSQTNKEISISQTNKDVSSHLNNDFFALPKSKESDLKLSQSSKDTLMFKTNENALTSQTNKDILPPQTNEETVVKTPQSNNLIGLTVNCITEEHLNPLKVYAEEDITYASPGRIEENHFDAFEEVVTELEHKEESFCYEMTETKFSISETVIFSEENDPKIILQSEIVNTDNKLIIKPVLQDETNHFQNTSASDDDSNDSTMLKIKYSDVSDEDSIKVKQKFDQSSKLVEEFHKSEGLDTLAMIAAEQPRLLIENNLVSNFECKIIKTTKTQSKDPKKKTTKRKESFSRKPVRTRRRSKMCANEENKCVTRNSTKKVAVEKKAKKAETVETKGDEVGSTLIGPLDIFDEKTIDLDFTLIQTANCEEADEVSIHIPEVNLICGDKRFQVLKQVEEFEFAVAELQNTRICSDELVENEEDVCVSNEDVTQSQSEDTDEVQKSLNGRNELTENIVVEKTFVNNENCVENDTTKSQNVDLNEAQKISMFDLLNLIPVKTASSVDACANKNVSIDDSNFGESAELGAEHEKLSLEEKFLIEKPTICEESKTSLPTDETQLESLCEENDNTSEKLANTVGNCASEKQVCEEITKKVLVNKISNGECNILHESDKLDEKLPFKTKAALKSFENKSVPYVHLVQLSKSIIEKICFNKPQTAYTKTIDSINDNKSVDVTALVAQNAVKINGDIQANEEILITDEKLYENFVQEMKDSLFVDVKSKWKLIDCCEDQTKIPVEEEEIASIFIEEKEINLEENETSIEVNETNLVENKTNIDEVKTETHFDESGTSLEETQTNHEEIERSVDEMVFEENKTNVEIKGIKTEDMQTLLEDEAKVVDNVNQRIKLNVNKIHCEENKMEVYVYEEIDEKETNIDIIQHNNDKVSVVEKAVEKEDLTKDKFKEEMKDDNDKSEEDHKSEENINLKEDCKSEIRTLEEDESSFKEETDTAGTKTMQQNPCVNIEENRKIIIKENIKLLPLNCVVLHYKKDVPEIKENELNVAWVQTSEKDNEDKEIMIVNQESSLLATKNYEVEEDNYKEQIEIMSMENQNTKQKQTAGVSLLEVDKEKEEKCVGEVKLFAETAIYEEALNADKKGYRKIEENTEVVTVGKKCEELNNFNGKTEPKCAVDNKKCQLKTNTKNRKRQKQTIDVVIKKLQKQNRAHLHRNKHVCSGRIDDPFANKDGVEDLQEKEKIEYNVCLDDAKIVNADAKIVNADAEIVNADAEIVNADAEIVNADAEIVNADAEIVNVDTRSVNVDIEIVNVGAKTANVDDRIVNVNGDIINLKISQKMEVESVEIEQKETMLPESVNELNVIPKQNVYRNADFVCVKNKIEKNIKEVQNRHHLNLSESKGNSSENFMKKNSIVIKEGIEHFMTEDFGAKGKIHDFMTKKNIEVDFTKKVEIGEDFDNKMVEPLNKFECIKGTAETIECSLAEGVENEGVLHDINHTISQSPNASPTMIPAVDMEISDTVVIDEDYSSLLLQPDEKPADKPDSNLELPKIQVDNSKPLNSTETLQQLFVEELLTSVDYLVSSNVHYNNNGWTFHGDSSDHSYNRIGDPLLSGKYDKIDLKEVINGNLPQLKESTSGEPSSDNIEVLPLDSKCSVPVQDNDVNQEPSRSLSVDPASDYQDVMTDYFFKDLETFDFFQSNQTESSIDASFMNSASGQSDSQTSVMTTKKYNQNDSNKNNTKTMDHLIGNGNYSKKVIIEPIDQNNLSVMFEPKGNSKLKVSPDVMHQKRIRQRVLPKKSVGDGDNESKAKENLATKLENIVPTRRRTITPVSAYVKKNPPKLVAEVPIKDTATTDEAKDKVEINDKLLLEPIELPKPIPKQKPKFKPMELSAEKAKAVLLEMPKLVPMERPKEPPKLIKQEPPKLIIQEPPKLIIQEPPKLIIQEPPKAIMKELQKTKQAEEMPPPPLLKEDTQKVEPIKNTKVADETPQVLPKPSEVPKVTNSSKYDIVNLLQKTAPIVSTPSNKFDNIKLHKRASAIKAMEGFAVDEDVELTRPEPNKNKSEEDKPQTTRPKRKCDEDRQSKSKKPKEDIHEAIKNSLVTNSGDIIYGKRVKIVTKTAKPVQVKERNKHLSDNDDDDDHHNKTKRFKHNERPDYEALFDKLRKEGPINNKCTVNNKNSTSPSTRPNRDRESPRSRGYSPNSSHRRHSGSSSIPQSQSNYHQSSQYRQSSHKTKPRHSNGYQHPGSGSYPRSNKNRCCSDNIYYTGFYPGLPMSNNLSSQKHPTSYLKSLDQMLPKPKVSFNTPSQNHSGTETLKRT